MILGNIAMFLLSFKWCWNVYCPIRNAFIHAFWELGSCGNAHHCKLCRTEAVTVYWEMLSIWVLWYWFESRRSISIKGWLMAGYSMYESILQWVWPLYLGDVTPPPPKTHCGCWLCNFLFPPLAYSFCWPWFCLQNHYCREHDVLGVVTHESQFKLMRSQLGVRWDIKTSIPTSLSLILAIK